MSLLLLLLRNINRIIPIKASKGVNDEGFNRLTKILSLSIPVRLKIQDVTVVPIFAPIITLIACPSAIMPEFTNPTTITVVAELDWITAVTATPSKRPFHLLEVILESTVCSVPPALFSRASPIKFIPNRNRASPPTKFKTLKILIAFLH